MPGALRTEGFRATPVILRHGHRKRRLVISGVPAQPDLARVLDEQLVPVEPPPIGLMISERVAKLLHLRIAPLNDEKGSRPACPYVRTYS